MRPVLRAKKFWCLREDISVFTSSAKDAVFEEIHQHFSKAPKQATSENYFFKPISLSRSSRYSPAVMSS